jgi:hypothetical protein
MGDEPEPRNEALSDVDDERTERAMRFADDYVSGLREPLQRFRNLFH